MKQKIPCALCAQDAVAELFGECLCPGCLLRMMVGEDLDLPIHCIENEPASQLRRRIEKDTGTIDV